MLCYDFLIIFGIRKVTSQPYSRFPGNRSTLRICFSLGIPHLVWSDLAGHLHSDCPGQCFIRNERIHLGCFHQPDSSSLSSLSSVAFLLMLRYQRNQHRPPNNLLRKAHGCSSNPAGLQYSYATRNTCPIHLYYN